MGYKLAGYDIVAANEIDKKFKDLYIKNHNPKHFFNCDIRDLIREDFELPQELYDIDILDGSPPCFDGDHLVMTNFGFKRIKDICLGDKVMTHKQRFKEVIDVMNKKVKSYEVVKIQGSLPIKTTKEHPFFVRELFYDKIKRTKTISDPIWKEVKDLSYKIDKTKTTQDYIGVAINQNSKLPNWSGVSYIHNIFGKEFLKKK